MPSQRRNLCSRLDAPKKATDHPRQCRIRPPRIRPRSPSLPPRPHAAVAVLADSVRVRTKGVPPPPPPPRPTIPVLSVLLPLRPVHGDPRALGTLTPLPTTSYPATAPSPLRNLPQSSPSRVRPFDLAPGPTTAPAQRWLSTTVAPSPMTVLAYDRVLDVAAPSDAASADYGVSYDARATVYGVTATTSSYLCPLCGRICRGGRSGGLSGAMG